MPSAYALGIVSGNSILDFGAAERLRALRCSFFTGGLEMGNGRCSAASYGSATLRTFPTIAARNKKAIVFASLHQRWLRIGAADEARTRYLHLGKVALYQMSYGRTFHLFVPGFRPATLVIIPHTPAVVNHKFTFFQKRMSFCSDTFFFILRAARTPPFSPCFTPLCAQIKYSCFLFHKLL